MADWALAAKVTLRAHLWRGRLYVDASGETPQPGYRVKIKDDPDPAVDYMVKWLPPEGPGPDVMTPYWVTQSFFKDARSITVRTADGISQVQVEGVPSEALVAADRSRAPSGPTAVGHSRKWDLAEAMRDAIRQLPDTHSGTPDWLYTYTAVSIGAEIGGFEGADRLRVEVREG